MQEPRGKGFVDDIDFRLGFICATRKQSLAQQQQLASWNRILTAKHKLFVHPRSSVRTATDERGRVVVLIGDTFVAHGDAELDALLLRVAAGERACLDDISGRFALFVFDDDEGTVLHDPLGSQAVFYTLGPDAVVASHASLLAEQTDQKLSKRLQSYMQTDGYRRRTTRFLPGDLTLYERIVHLIPNNELSMRTGSTRRYWPSAPLAPSTLPGLHDIWSEYFERYAAFLRTRYEPVIGLTGGLDSRTIIASLRRFGVRARYVTWNMGEEEAARIPGLVAHLESPHQWLELSKDAVNPRFEAVRGAAKVATGYTRGTPVLPALMAELATDRSVFVKGLGGEVMRGPWNTQEKPWLPPQREAMMFRLYAGQSSGAAERTYDEITAQAFEAFVARANYQGDLHGVDVGDLFYWEARMGNWTSVQHAEMAIAMQSHSAMNSRRLFSSAWGLSREDRFSPRLLVDLMRSFDPVIADL